MWTDLGAGDRDIVGVLLYKHVTDDTDSVPIAFLDGGDFPLALSSGTSQVTLSFASGVALSLS